jgi:hypothetical protein
MSRKPTRKERSVWGLFRAGGDPQGTGALKPQREPATPEPAQSTVSMVALILVGALTVALALCMMPRP